LIQEEYPERKTCFSSEREREFVGLLSKEQKTKAKLSMKEIKVVKVAR
jgi:hypothetical protein